MEQAPALHPCIWSGSCPQGLHHFTGLSKMFGLGAFTGGGGQGRDGNQNQNRGQGNGWLYPILGGSAFAASQNTTYQQFLNVRPFAYHPTANAQELEQGDKILLPQSALDVLVRQQIEYPMMFQISNKNPSINLSTHCGVMEFSAEEGLCYLPHWLMQSLCLSTDARVEVRNVSLQKATYVKLQPQECDFLELNNPKAMLEVCLRRFSCLTLGKTICVQHNNRNYHIEVKALQPADACSIIETDCNVDFEEPPGWAEYCAAKAASAAEAASAAAASAAPAAADAADGTTKKETGMRLGSATQDSDRIGKPASPGLDLAKLAEERAARRRLLKGEVTPVFTGSGRRPDGRPVKKKKLVATSESGGASKDMPPPAPQASTTGLAVPAAPARTAPPSSEKRRRNLAAFKKKQPKLTSFVGGGRTLGAS